MKKSMFVMAILGFSILLLLCERSYAAYNSDAILSVQNLIFTTEQMSLEEGLAKSLLGKLSNALDSLTADNATKRKDAVKKLSSFRNEVRAQCDKKITEEQCIALIQQAEQAIENCRDPVIISVSRSAGSPGELITVRGYNFGRTQGDGSISFGGTSAADIKSWGETLIEVAIPNGAMSGPVVVEVGGRDSNAIVFIVDEQGKTFNELLPLVYPSGGVKADLEPDPVIGIPTSISRLLIIFADGVMAQQVAEILAQYSLQMIGTLPSISLVLVEIATPSNLENLKNIAQELRALPEVEVVMTDILLGPTTLPPNPTLVFEDWTWEPLPAGGNWGQEFAHFPGAWNALDYILASGIPQISIGIVDFNFDPSHPELTGVLEQVSDVNYTDCDFDDPACKYHGNLVAGVIGAKFFDEFGINGANPIADIKIMAAPSGSNLWEDTFWQIQWLLINVPDLKVINISMGCNWYRHTKLNPNTNQDIHEEIERDGKTFALTASYAAEQGVIITVSAGNESGNHGWGWVDAKWASPLCYAAATGSENIIVVGALKYYPIYSDALWISPAGYTCVGDTVDIMAPGSDIKSTSLPNPDVSREYRTDSGTSLAAPMVAGLIGYMYAFEEQLDWSEVIQYMTGAHNVGESGWIIDRTIDDADLNGDSIFETYTFNFLDAFQTMMRIPGFAAVVADVDGDNDVDWDDRSKVELYVGDLNEAYKRHDINGDGWVDEEDLEIIEPFLQKIVDTISVGEFPRHLAVTPNGSYVYVTNWFDNTVSVIQTSDNTVIKTISVGGHPNDVAVTPDGSYVYVTNDSNSTVSVIQTSNNTAIKTISVGFGPAGVAVTPNGDYVYVANEGDDTVSVIRTSDNIVTQTIPVGDRPHYVAVTPDGSYVYVTNWNDATVSVIQTWNNAIIETIPLSGNAYGIGITPDGSYVYVTNNMDDMVSVIQTFDNTVIKTIPVGNSPLDLAVTPDGSYVYVTSWEDGNVSIIQTTQDSVIKTIFVGNSPEGVAVTPNGDYVYVTNRGYDTVSVIGF